MGYTVEINKVPLGGEVIATAHEGRKVEYFYRDYDGEVYRTVAATQDAARALRDEWLRKKQRNHRRH